MFKVFHFFPFQNCGYLEDKKNWHNIAIDALGDAIETILTKILTTTLDNKLDNNDNCNDVSVKNFENVRVGKSVKNSMDKKYTRKRNAHILP